MPTNLLLKPLTLNVHICSKNYRLFVELFRLENCRTLFVQTQTTYHFSTTFTINHSPSEAVQFLSVREEGYIVVIVYIIHGDVDNTVILFLTNVLSIVIYK